MIVISPDLLADIEAVGAGAYPEEGCGLLIGHGAIEERLVVSRVEVSPNRTEGDKRKSFEIDPQLRFDLMRSLDAGGERIVGHFHSHPDGPACPSARDAEQVWEPELIWIVTAIAGGRPEKTAAYAFDEKGRRFRALELRLAA